MACINDNSASCSSFGADIGVDSIEVASVDAESMPSIKSFANVEVFRETAQYIVDDAPSCLLKGKKSPLSCIVKRLKGVLTKTIVAVFPRGSKKRKSKNDDKHDHGKEKMRPSTYVEGENK